MILRKEIKVKIHLQLTVFVNKICFIILGLISGLCSLGAVGTALGLVYGLKSKQKSYKTVSNS
jgi:hypothetical protein